MIRTFREWNPDQCWLFPPSPQDWLPDGHLVYFLMDVSEQLDLSPIIEKYDSEKGGKPPYHPRMMLVLLLYSYCIGVFSSRKIAARCETDVAFRVIVGDNIPDFRTISEYRRRHLEQFQHLFVEVLEQNDRVEEAYIATGRLKHHERVAPAPKGRIPAGLSAKEKMARKLRTKKGRAEYARRKAIAEPPFGQIKHCRGFRQFLLRSLAKMKAEWQLVALTHNLLKLFRTGAFATN